MSGTLVLGGVGLVNRLIGFGYNTYLIRLAGTEPSGLYRMVAPLYFALLTITCAGIPYAVSKRVAEARGRGDAGAVRRIPLLALGLLFVLGGVGALVLYGGADFIAEHAFADERVRVVLQWMAPGIWIVAIASALRGYLQGIHRMGPIAGSQLLEQVTHAAVTVGLTWAWMDQGVLAIAAAMAIGMVAGEAVGLVLMLILLVRRHFSRVRPGAISARWRRHLTRLQAYGVDDTHRLFQLAGPMVAGHLVYSILTAVYMAVIPHSLETTGLGPEEATAAFGHFLGIASPLVRFPTVIYAALALNVIPVISRGTAQNRPTAVRDAIDRSLKLTAAVAVPVLFLLTLMAEPIAQTIFRVPEAAPVIAATAASAPFIYLRLTTAGILRGLGRPGVSMRNQNVGLALDIGLAAWVAGVPGWGMTAVALAAGVTVVLVSLLNVRAIGKATGRTLHLKDYFLRPLGAAAIAAGITMGLYIGLGGALSPTANLAVVGLVGSGAYLAFLRRGSLNRH